MVLKKLQKMTDSKQTNFAFPVCHNVVTMTITIDAEKQQTRRAE